MLAQDAFNWFETHGGLTRANGQRFRSMVLSRGNTEDLAEMYRSFVGHDPDINPYLQYYGLTGGCTAVPEPVAPAAVAPMPSPAPAPAPAPVQPKKGERG
jgi:peptidyl-dipeptidase Dcp